MSSKAVFTVAPCHYALSSTDIPLAINGGSQRALVTTESYCRWTASADVPWVTIPGPTGVGIGFLGYRIDDNYAADGRTGTLSLGDAKWGRGEVTINCTVDGRMANAVTVVIK